MIITAELRMPPDSYLLVWNSLSRSLVGVECNEVTEGSIIFLTRVDINYMTREPLIHTPSLLVNRFARGVIKEVDDFEETSYKVADGKDEIIEIPNIYLLDSNDTPKLSYDVWLDRLSIKSFSSIQKFRPIEQSTIAIGCKYGDWTIEKMEKFKIGKKFTIQIAEPEVPCIYSMKISESKLFSMCNIIDTDGK